MSMDKIEKQNKFNKGFKTKYIPIKLMRISYNSINKSPNFVDFLQSQHVFQKKDREMSGGKKNTQPKLNCHLSRGMRHTTMMRAMRHIQRHPGRRLWKVGHHHTCYPNRASTTHARANHFLFKLHFIY